MTVSLAQRLYPYLRSLFLSLSMLLLYPALLNSSVGSYKRTMVCEFPEYPLPSAPAEAIQSIQKTTKARPTNPVDLIHHQYSNWMSHHFSIITVPGILPFQGKPTMPPTYYTLPTPFIEILDHNIAEHYYWTRKGLRKAV